MNRNIHHTDRFFKDAYHQFEEEPSADIWEKINAGLDKINAESYKKSVIGWKRQSLLLLLLLICLSIYELNTRRVPNHLAKTKGKVTSKAMVYENNNENNESVNNNVTISKEQFRSKDVKNTTLNAIPDDSSQMPRQYSFINDKQYQKNFLPDVKDITNTATALKQYTLFIKPPDDLHRQTPIVNNNFDQINNPIQFTQQLNLLPVEKVNTPVTLSPDLNKSLQSFALTKSNPLIDTKNPVAQQTKKKETKPSRFSITAFFSPDLASYSLKDNGTSNQPDNASQIKKTERHEFSSTSGLLVDYTLNKRWALQSGLTFSNTNITLDPKTIYAQADNNGNLKYRLNISSGYGYLSPSSQPTPSMGDSLKVTATAHKLRYISIPIAVKYSISKGKFKIEAITGIAVNCLTMGKLETEIQRGPNNETDILNKIQGLKSIYFNGLAGIGAEYRITYRFSFMLMPTVRFALNPINKGGVVKTYPISVGLAGGLRLRFVKL